MAEHEDSKLTLVTWLRKEKGSLPWLVAAALWISAVLLFRANVKKENDHLLEAGYAASMLALVASAIAFARPVDWMTSKVSHFVEIRQLENLVRHLPPEELGELRRMVASGRRTISIPDRSFPSDLLVGRGLLDIIKRNEWTTVYEVPLGLWKRFNRQPMKDRIISGKFNP